LTKEPAKQTPELAAEWCLLQNQLDSYEKHSLLIKLFSIGLLAAGYFSNQLSVFVLLLLLVLWLQDAIWKTFQSRIEQRLLQLERFLATQPSENSANNGSDENSAAYQFNTLYLQNRPSSIGLIKEYLTQALRPTIAFPHVALVALTAFSLWANLYIFNLHSAA